MTLCPKCGLKSDKQTTCPKCGLIYKKYKAPGSRAAVPSAPSSELLEQSPYEEPTFDGRLIPFDDLKLNIISLPVAFGFALFCYSFNFPYILGNYFFSIPIHELGHAVLSWLCSRMAIPIGFFIPMAAFTTWSTTSSPTLFCLFACLLVFVLVRGIQKNRKSVATLAGILTLTLIYCTFILPPQSREGLQVFGGIFGEFAISTLFVIGFYYRISNRIRWDFTRFLFLIWGAFAFLSAFSEWLKISTFKSGLPRGSFLNGGGDANGDVDRLLRDFGWDTLQVIHTYLNIGKICLCIIVLHYLIFAFLSFQARAKASIKTINANELS